MVRDVPRATAVTREAAVVDRIVRWLKSQAPEVYWEKRWGGPYGRAGAPDLSLCVRGQRVELEVKRPGGNGPTPSQVAELSRWAAAGAVTGVVRSLEDVRAIVEPLMGPRVDGEP